MPPKASANCPPAVGIDGMDGQPPPGDGVLPPNPPGMVDAVSPRPPRTTGPPCHTTAIGNRGIRTHAIRNTDDTLHLGRNPRLPTPTAPLGHHHHPAPPIPPATRPRLNTRLNTRLTPHPLPHQPRWRIDSPPLPPTTPPPTPPRPHRRRDDPTPDIDLHNQRTKELAARHHGVCGAMMTV